MFFILVISGTLYISRCQANIFFFFFFDGVMYTYTYKKKDKCPILSVYERLFKTER